MTSYPDIQRIDVYSPNTSHRLEFTVTREQKAWKARTLRLSKGRVMRAPNTRISAPRLEKITLQAKTYDELVSKCKEKFESDTGEQAKTMDSRYVKKRVEDWKVRLDDLFDIFEEELKDRSFSVSKSSKVEMNEELMQKFFIAPIDLKSMHVLKDGKTILMLKPKGLWIIGANGRVDMMTPTGSYLLVDTAEFGRKPKWVIYDKDMNNVPLTKAVVRRILADERIW